MAEKEKKPGRYGIGSAIIWAAAMGAVAYFYDPEQGWLTAAIAGLVSGFITARLLGRIAKFGAGVKVMVPAGVILGVLVSSGAATGLKYAFSAIGLALFGPPEFDTDALLKFILSSAVIPAAVLGAFTGIFVRMKIPRQKKK